VAGVSPILVFLVIVVVVVISISIIIGNIIVGSSIQKSSLSSFAMLAVDIFNGGVAWRVEVRAGGSPSIVFPGVLVFKVVGIVVIIGIVVCVIWNVVLSCSNCA